MTFITRSTKAGKVLILGLAIILVLTLDGQSQRRGDKQYVFVKFGDSRREIVDLTKAVEKNCSEVLTRKVGNNSIEVKYQAEYAAEAKAIINTLEKIMNEIQNILSPLQVDNLKLYMFQMPQVPVNYKMSEMADGKDFYLHFVVFKDKYYLDTTTCNISQFCSDIFGTLPHELTHSALDGLITRKETRWFDDGLAEFVANSVYKKLSPVDFEKKYESASSRVSLFRRDIREDILRWDERGTGILKITRRDLSNEIYRYRAAYELISQIVEQAKEKGIDNPLGVLLIKLKENREKTGKPSDTDDIISIIMQNLKVDSRTLGELDAKTQQGLVDEAVSLLSKDDISNEKKNYALYILASIDGITISDKWINYLLDQIYENKSSDDNQRDIAATALTVRFKQIGFDELLKTYISNNQQLKGKSVKKIKSELAEFSLRPRPD